MTIEEALATLDAVLQPQRLSDIQELVLRQTWAGQSYQEIAQASSYDTEYIGHVGAKLWRFLSQALGEKVTKSNIRSVLRRRLEQTRGQTAPQKLQMRERTIKRQDWGEAIDASVFYGRSEELVTLKQWIVDDRCRLIALVGMGGIGKTALAVKLAEQIQDEFEYLIWRSLRNALPIEELLTSLIQFISNHQETNLPTTLDSQIARLLDYLRSSRCLLVLDNAESIFRSGDHMGRYREGYEGYGQLLRRVGEERHTSCLLLTSREKPIGLASKEDKTLTIRAFKLMGLQAVESQKLLKTKDLFSGSADEWRLLIERYSGNPLALKLVATSIQELFDGNISKFLEQDTSVFGEIYNLLEQQFNRLSELEKQSMYWLAINRERISMTELGGDFVPPVSTRELLETLQSLQRRSLIEQKAGRFTQQPVVMEYMSEHLIEQVYQEINTQKIAVFKSYALIKATAKDFVKKTQIRVIVQPIIKKLLTLFKENKKIENQLFQILSMLKGKPSLETGYAGGNVLNLLWQLQKNLSCCDFSELTIWQAYLKDVNLYQVNFTGTNLAKSVFMESMGSVFSVAFSPDGKLLAAGDIEGKIRLWQVANGSQLLTCEGHTDFALAVAFSPDGQILASGSQDQTIKLWDVSDGKCLKTLQAPENQAKCIAFSPDGQTLAIGSNSKMLGLWNISTNEYIKTCQGHNGALACVAFSFDGQIIATGSTDSSVKLWDVSTGRCLETLQGHSGTIWSVAFSPFAGKGCVEPGVSPKEISQILASGGDDSVVRLWDVRTGQCLQTLQGHTASVCGIAFSPQGRILASGSDDRTIKLWDVKTGECFRTLLGHLGRVWSITFNQDGQTLASGSDDNTVRLWDINTAQSIQTLRGYSSQVWSVAFSPDGPLLASGSDDGVVRFWDVNTGQCLQTLKKSTSRVWFVAFSPQGNTLATSSCDQLVKLWDISTGQCLQTFRGHNSLVWSIAFSPNGQVLASGSMDSTAKLWDIRTGQCRQTLKAHNSNVWHVTVAFSPNGEILATGSADSTAKLWDIRNEQCLQILQEHTAWVRSVAFSPNGQILATGSDDQTVKLWDVSDGKCLKTLKGHGSGVCSVTFSPDSQILVTGSDDQTVKLWNVLDGKCLKTLKGHCQKVLSVAFSSDNLIVASGSHDQTIKLWNANTGKCLKTLIATKPYESMNITGVTGLTAATIATLKTLGAVELA